MPELTVASTTDTEDEVKLAANVPVVPEPEEEQEQPEQEKQPADEHETKPAKNSFQKRIDRLTRDKSEAERKAQALEDRVKELEGTTLKPEVQEPQRQSSRTKPKADDTDAQGKAKYATYEDFIEDLADWKVEQRESAKQEQEAKKTFEEQRTKTLGQYNRQVNDFKKEHPDFDNVVNQEIMIPQVAIDTIVELGNPGIAYYLGQHPEVCDELSKNISRPGWIAARIGQIDTQTSVAPSIDAEEEEPEPVPVRRSAAPPPIKPVGGSATKSSVPLDEMPYSEYRKLRDRQQKERYRR